MGYKTTTSNLLAKKELDIDVVNAETVKLTNAIVLKKENKQANLKRVETQTISAARAAAKGVVEKAKSVGKKLEAEALRNFFSNLSSTLGFNATHLNTIKWIEMVEVRSSGRAIYTDSHQPRSLQLDGQRALYESQLSATT